jgi:hypothetical protein
MPSSTFEADVAVAQKDLAFTAPVPGTNTSFDEELLAPQEATAKTPAPSRINRVMKCFFGAVFTMLPQINDDDD